MSNKKTAVEWLKSKLTRCVTATDQRQAFEQAKQMEKEQIIGAYEYGYWRGNNDDDFEPEEYYENPYFNPNDEFYGKDN